MALWLFLLPSGFAQDGGFDAHGFRFASPDADVRDPITFLRPGDQRTLETSFGLLGEYARQPLRFEPREGEREVLLQDLVAVNVGGGFVPWGPIRLGVELPVVLSSANPAAGVDVQPTVLGDLRLTGMAVLVQPSNASGLGLGLVGHASLPTGDPELWLGEGDVAGGGAFVGTIEADRLAASWRLGARFTPQNPATATGQRTRGGDVFEGAFAMSLLASDSFGVGAEANLALPMAPTVRRAIGIPAEAMLTGRYVHQESGVFLAGGIGTALGAGAGASPVRAVFGGGFALGSGAGADRDGDGLSDAADACIDEPELLNGYRDEDGCPDALPRLVFRADVSAGEGTPVAAIAVTMGNGTVQRGAGEVSVQSRPGQVLVAEARVGACRLGSVEVRVADQPEQVIAVPVKRVSARARITVQDAAGRFLPQASVRYIVDDPVCGPADSSLVEGAGIHDIGAGESTVLVTAPGYDIHQQVLALEPGEEALIKAVLKPTQVQARDGALVFATPLLFVPRSSTLAEGAESLLSQIASVVLAEGLRIRVTGHPDAGGAGGRSLAWARANALRDELVAQGVPEESVVTKGGRTALASGHVEIRILP